MRVNDLDLPFGIDQTPRFSWIAESAQRGDMQTAYEIEVADELESTVWNSGKVKSANCCQITYGGSDLKPKSVYKWKVRIWDQNDEVGNWSSWQNFETAMLSASDWQAKWIQADDRNEVVNVVHVFEQPVKTRYVRLYAQKLGLVVRGESNQYRIQLSEMEIFDSEGNNLALGKRVYDFSLTTVPDEVQGYILDGKEADRLSLVYDMCGRIVDNSGQLLSQAGVYIKNGQKCSVR